MYTYHGEENAKLCVHVDGVSVCEDESFLAFFLTLQHNGDLLSCDRQDGELDTVELVETTP